MIIFDKKAEAMEVICDNPGCHKEEEFVAFEFLEGVSKAKKVGWLMAFDAARDEWVHFCCFKCRAQADFL